ncbi:hypothetical protein FOL46_006808 [Perkinsus olseni]|uniref:Nitrogen permease regulator 2 n=1 Tax=Perkinsus olseni TaxID=32597 RepID=A0A7J6LHU6_PEROL|nr:hypothetical protein FOL46_006808 [Perkinsus olseni]
MRLLALIALFLFRYISLVDSRDQAVSKFWPGVAGQFFILNLLISLIYLGVAHWTLRACECFQKFVEIGAVIFIMHHVFYTLLDSQRAQVLIEFFTGWKDEDNHGPALYDEGVAVLVAIFGLTSASLCGRLSVFKVFMLLCYTICLFFLYLILLSEEPYQTWWEYILLHVAALALISLVIFLALRRCDIGWRHRFIQGRTVRSEMALHRKVKPFYSAQRRLLAAVFDTVFVVGGESFEIIDNDNKKLDEFFGGQMNMLGMNLLSLLGADEVDGESWTRTAPNRRESEYERFYNYMRLLGSEGNNW